MKVLFACFVLIPVLEMILLIKVGGAIGILPTIGLVLLTAVIGVALLRQQGWSTLFRAQDKMRQGELPLEEMVEGIFLAVGGALLLTPGFLTDAVGFSCLIPGIRKIILVHGARLFKPDIIISSTVSETQNRDTIEGVCRREDKTHPPD